MNRLYLAVSQLDKQIFGSVVLRKWEEMEDCARLTKPWLY